MEKILLIRGILLGAFILLAVYHILVFLGRRNDFSNLIYSIYCLSIASLMFCRTIYPLISHSPNDNIFNIGFIISCNFIAGSVMFFYHIKLQMKKNIGYIISNTYFIFMTIYGIILSILYFFIKNKLLIQLYFPVIGFFAFLYTFIIISKIIKKDINFKRNLIVLSGFIFITLSFGILAIFVSIGFRPGFWFVYLPLLINVLIFAYALTDSFNKDHNTLVDLTNSLEQKVKDRTNKLTLANNQLKSLDTLKNDFIANITHGFRSPLTIILNLSDIALKYEKRLSGKVKYSVEQIYNSAVKMKTFVDKLLDVAKMDAKGIKLSVKMVGLVSFIKRLSEFYSTSVMLSRIKITTKLPDNEIKNFYTDQGKLEEIIDNIMSNAIKFVDVNHGKIEIELQDNADFVSIIITDNGIGIPGDKLQSIFKRFEQVEPGRDSIYKGTGIGLAYAKQLVDCLKGNIRAESEGEGKGAKFIIKLKKGRNIFNENDFYDEEHRRGLINQTRKHIKILIQKDLQEKLEEKGVSQYITERNKEDEFDYQKGIILVVDDEKHVLSIVRNYLTNNGYKNIILATDGKEALDAVYEYSPDLIICDYNMPNMKGDKFHDVIADNPSFKFVPFIFLSAIADKNVMLQRRQKGAVAYLKKPIDEKELLLITDQNLKKHMEYLKTIRLSKIDELTGLNNKGSVTSELKHELTVRRYRDLSIIFIDFDNFKNFNDTYGHPVGDKALAGVGKIIKTSIRTHDIAGRYGGEEFILILPDTNMEQAAIVAEELREKIKNSIIKYNSKDLSITASFGISSLKDNEDHITKKMNIESLKNIYEVTDTDNVNWDKINEYKLQVVDIIMEIADSALYKAKQTICKQCGFNSTDAQLFKQKKCPECNSNELIIGRDRVVVFK